MNRNLMLIRKDLLLMIQLKYAWILIVYFVVFSAFFDNPFMKYGYFPLLLIVLSAKLDVKESANKLLLSLPLSRKNIVFSKYGSAVVMIVGGLLLSAVMDAVMQLARKGTYISEPGMISVIFIGLLLYVSLFFPISYWLGPKYFQFMSIFMFALLTAAGLSSDLMLGSVGDWAVSHMALSTVATILFTALLLAISYQISLRLFEKRNG